MPKILHIGGVNSPHVMGIVEQIKQYTDFEQTIVSYPATPHPSDLEKLKDIRIHYYNYPLFFKNKPVASVENTKLARFAIRVLEQEKPDIIHGHYLSKCAVAMAYFVGHSKKPGIVVPWSTWDIPNSKHMITRNQQCLDLCRYVMCNHTGFLNSLLDFFKQPRSKALFSFPPIRLYLYGDKPPNTDVPRLFITRRHYQDVFMRALPKVISMFPNIEITALSPNDAINLAKHLGIHNRIKFLPDMVSQEDFAKLVQEHNIVRSMSLDHGTSSTTIQAAYSGAVTLVHKSNWDYFKDGVNVVKCNMTVEDIQEKLIYSIQNLPNLCTKFKQNNAFLKAWDAKVTWDNLYSAYTNMLNG